ncbi:MAG: hypothetical protein AAFP03_13215, partial [Cyanobacteria bacterium J06598_3]
VQGCVPGNDSTGRFVQSGRGGLGTNPYGVLNNRTSLADISVPRGLAFESSAVGAAPNIESSVNEEQIVSTAAARVEEARGWAINERGDVVLLASASDKQSARCLRWQS